MNNHTKPAKISVSDEVLFQEIEGEAVLLNLNTEMYFGLDKIGTRFWHLISENGNLDFALSALKGEYDVETSILKDDLDELINELVENGLVKVEEE